MHAEALSETPLLTVMPMKSILFGESFLSNQPRSMPLSELIFSKLIFPLAVNVDAELSEPIVVSA